ncbi:MAG: hypothetical protein AAF564_15515 [Bacteroidota bacterium]
MPEEIFVIIVVAIGAGTFMSIVGMMINYLKTRSEQGTGNSMTTSELEGMIQKWIEESTQPLVDRLDEMEAQLNSADKSGGLLDGMDAYEDDEALEPARREKSRR